MIKLKKLIFSILKENSVQYPSPEEFGKSRFSYRDLPSQATQRSAEYTLLPKNIKPNQLVYYNDKLCKVIGITPIENDKSYVWVELENRSDEAPRTKIFSLRLDKNARVFKRFKRL